jgi:hypothetical protein
MSTGLGVDPRASDNSRAFFDGRRGRVDLRTAIEDSFAILPVLGWSWGCWQRVCVVWDGTCIDARSLYDCIDVIVGVTLLFGRSGKKGEVFRERLQWGKGAIRAFLFRRT